MRLIRGLQHFPIELQKSGCALTIGNFDGVHLGHQAVLYRLRGKATELGLPMVVMLFEPQPSEYFLVDNAPSRLMRLRDKLSALAELGVDYVIRIKFDHIFAKLSAQHFIYDYLVKKINVKFLSVGDDFRFGLQRQGDFSLLQKAGKEYGFMVEDNSSFCLNEERISSTAIRQALAKDNLGLAQQLLGKPYCIYGRVVQGNKLGRTIGFPTANIRLQRQVNPVKGVYAVKVKLPNNEVYFGVANIGCRPTINGVKQLLEVHLFDFKENIYGKTLQVELCCKIRDEIKFPSFDELKEQIVQDVEIAKSYFKI